MTRRSPAAHGSKRTAAPRAAAAGRLSVAPLDARRWNDFASLLGERGGCGGCWCMAWRLPKTEWEKGKGEGNRKAMKDLVAGGAPVGLIAYRGGAPVGWCSVSPRESFVRLGSSRVLKPIDDKPVWSISCFFIAKEYRRKGISTEVLKLATGYYRKMGVKILEGYPVVPYSGAMPGAFAWTGILPAFLAAGFKRERGWSKSRPIMRRYLTS